MRQSSRQGRTQDAVRDEEEGREIERLTIDYQDSVMAVYLARGFNTPIWHVEAASDCGAPAWWVICRERGGDRLAPILTSERASGATTALTRAIALNRRLARGEEGDEVAAR